MVDDIIGRLENLVNDLCGPVDPWVIEARVLELDAQRVIAHVDR
jgi:hypothetical protein